MKVTTPSFKIIKILILGLERTGKTSIARYLSLKPINVTYKPTIGVNFFKIRFQDEVVVLWDLGGKPRFRELWNIFFPGTDGIIFVADPNNKSKLTKSIKLLLQVKNILMKPTVLLLNKNDKSNDKIQTLVKKLLNDKNIPIVKTSVIAKQGIEDALNLLLKEIKINKSPIQNFTDLLQQKISN
ncbi:MAG: ADP-ribosylation factor-like protein [Candidatus Ranarchaeia archaeon]